MDDADSIKALLAKANAGDAEAQNSMGRFAISSGGPNARTDAEAWFRRAAEQGLSKAKHNLGVLYLQQGQIRPEALKWFYEAAQEGWLPSIFAMGMIAQDDDRMEEAQRLFEIAAQRGHAESQDALGRIYFDRNTGADYVIARRWSEAAAEHGIAAAQARLATIFHEGLGTPRDPQRAANYFRAAAHNGHAGAQAMWGVAHDIGVGAPVDKIEAAHWLMRSTEQSHELAHIYLPDLMKRLQPHEVDEAERRAREPLPRSH
ncbi:MAG TPA: tetratricopeptide repeat protein [Xanthobacteraceae bacterium]|nr:tetratricopeptide repeat protein [Xanthobacteraceae bacterium]